ncbi:MAG: hypothetical protein ABIR66_05780 [Saprospiraceae bacterium]
MKTLHLAIPIVVLILFSTVMIFISNELWSIGLVASIICLVVLFILKDALDWRYYQKHPPELELKVKTILDQVPFYKHLNQEQKKKFETRLALFIIAHKFKIQPTKRLLDEEDEFEAPDDLKAYCSIPAIILTFEQESYLCPEILQIIFYNHPFPSPAYKILHHSEYNAEDKVLIFSVPHLRKGVLEPYVYFDLGMYEWSRASQIQSIGSDWNTFEKTYGIMKVQAEASIGLTAPDIKSVQKVFEVHRSYLTLLL